MTEHTEHTDGTVDVGSDEAAKSAVSGEDVLDGDVPPPAGPRTRFHRKRDAVGLVVLVGALVATGVAVWQGSEVRATASTTAPAEVAAPADPDVFPPSLGEVWRARSGATPVPVVAGPTVVAADGGEVRGLDPLTGDVRWSYRRDLQLCTVAAGWSKVLALYRTDGNLLPGDDLRADGGCSEVTALKPASGERDSQRNTDAEPDARLVGDLSYVTAVGPTLLTTWRSDLVKTVDYGLVPAAVNPDRQPRTNCAFGSVTTFGGRIAVVERCQDEDGDRLTVYKATGKDSDRPEVTASMLLPGRSAQVVALTDTLVSVALPDPGRLQVYDDTGQKVADHQIDLAPGELKDPPGRAAQATRTPGAVFWFTGSRTIAVSTTDLTPLWTVRDTLGPGVMFAGRALFPVATGLSVRNQVDGTEVGNIGVERDGHTGQVELATLGPIVFEQRGSTLVALR